MKLVKKLSIYFLLMVLLLLFTSCKNNVEIYSEASMPKADASGWTFTVEDFQISKSLKDISTSIAYGGASTSKEVSETAPSGKKFLLIKMTVEKKKGSKTIDWSKLTLIDSSGNTYSRLKDSFLEGFGFKRMKGTTLSFGENHGWIAFEVNEVSKDFKLQYDFTEEKLTLELKD